MTDIGGTKTVYAPVTPKVDNNAKPSTGTSNGPVSPGLLQPGPNNTWVEDVAEQPRAPAWQKAQVSEEAKDRRQSALANGTAITIGHLSPQIQQQTNAAIAGLAARQDEQSGSASGTGSSLR
jgi:hypothetical protein